MLLPMDGAGNIAIADYHIVPMGVPVYQDVDTCALGELLIFLASGKR